jgi:hypothetical protein
VNTIRKLSAGLLALLSVVAYAGGATPQVQQAIAEAKAAYKKADSLQGAWLSADKLIKQAEAAAAKGDNAKAMELAKKSTGQSELAYAQALDQKEHWSPPSYLDLQ